MFVAVMVECCMGRMSGVGNCNLFDSTLQDNQAVLVG